AAVERAAPADARDALGRARELELDEVDLAGRIRPRRAQLDPLHAVGVGHDADQRHPAAAVGDGVDAAVLRAPRAEVAFGPGELELLDPGELAAHQGRRRRLAAREQELEVRDAIRGRDLALAGAEQERRT